MKRDVRLYNMLLPIWLILFFPTPLWFGILPGNFIIDFLVLLLGFKVAKVQGIRKIIWRTVWKVWLLGFAADFIGCIILFCSQMGSDIWWYEHITSPVSFNPFDNWFSLLFVLLAVLVSGVFIYLFNRFVSLAWISIERKKKQIISLLLALLTMPYVFLIPSELLYFPEKELRFFANEFEIQTKTSSAAEYTENNEQLPEEESVHFSPVGVFTEGHTRFDFAPGSH